VQKTGTKVPYKIHQKNGFEVSLNFWSAIYQSTSQFWVPNGNLQDAHKCVLHSVFATLAEGAEVIRYMDWRGASNRGYIPEPTNNPGRYLTQQNLIENTYSEWLNILEETSCHHQINWKKRLEAGKKDESHIN